MAYADDITAMLSSNDKYKTLQETIKPYEEVSNAKFSSQKAICLTPTFTETDKEGKITKEWTEPDWYDQVEEPRHPQDYKHLGCFLRMDGEIPHELIGTLLARARLTAHLWEMRKLTMKARIRIMKTHILGTLWHAIQICPLPEDFENLIINIIKPFTFHTTRAPIEFDLTCRPLLHGGLNIMHPGLMLNSLCGMMIARAFSDQSIIGKAFRLSFLRELDRVGADFFRLFGKGKSHKTKNMRPFWHRVYLTIRNLGLSVEENWETYTDEEILSIPCYLPAIMSEETLEFMRERTRSQWLHGRMYLWKDILSYRPRKSPPIDIHETKVAVEIINKRLTALNRTDDIRRPGESTKEKRVARDILHGFSDFRQIWEKVKSEFPEKFMERLKQIQPPTMTSAIACICYTTLKTIPKIQNTHYLIPWNKLTLAGIPYRNFTIRQSRKTIQEKGLIIPNWTDTDWAQPADERGTTELWKEAWKTANWKSRPDDHFEAYWLLLHKRSPRFRKRNKRDETAPLKTTRTQTTTRIPRTNIQYPVIYATKWTRTNTHT